MTRFLTILIWGLLAAGPASAQDAADSTVTASTLSPDDQSRVAMRLMTGFLSPYCPGANLRDCGSGQAEILRQRIRDWVAEGRNEEWITAAMVDEFGESILGKPLFQGWGIAAYVAPVLAVLLGLAGLLTYLSRQNRAPSRPPEGAIQTPDDFRLSDDKGDQVERELKVRSHP